MLEEEIELFHQFCTMRVMNGGYKAVSTVLCVVSS